MINSNNNALGIIFPNSYDAFLPELTGVRLMASVPFASRYRMIDFVLSSMSNNGIDNVAIMVNKSYHSLIDHLGAGREWDLVRRSGGLHIFPPYAIGTSKPYTGRVGAITGILDWLRDQKEEYVVISDANIAANFDFSAMIAEHKASGADVSVAYNVCELPAELTSDTDNSKGLYYTFDINDGRINYIYVNERAGGVKNVSMNIYLVSRELLIEQVNIAYVRGLEYFERDILLPQLDKLNVHAFKFDGYCVRLAGLKSYFDANMALLDDANLDGLFAGNQIYTKIRDDNPTRYIAGSKVENIMAADGCVIEGEVENSILFRGVKIGKGAKVKNCILLQDTVVADGASLEYVVADKSVTVTEGKSVSGTDSFPVYIGKLKTV